jgi:hypothetical protein
MFDFRCEEMELIRIRLYLYLNDKMSSGELIACVLCLFLGQLSVAFS